MSKFLLIVLAAGLGACNEAAKVEKEADTLYNNVKNSETMDSILTKGGRLRDSIESKGGKVIDDVKEKFNDLKKKKSSK